MLANVSLKGNIVYTVWQHSWLLWDWCYLGRIVVTHQKDFLHLRSANQNYNGSLFSLFCSHHFKHPIIHFCLFLQLTLICCCEIPDLIIINHILNVKNVSFIRMALMSPPPVNAKEYFSNPLTLPNNLGWKLLLAKILEKIFPKELESCNKSKHCNVCLASGVGNLMI